MRRLPVRYREAATEDLEEIFRFVLKMSENQATAKAYVRRLKARCDRIGDIPLGGRARDDLFAGLRTVPFEGRAVIAYTVEQNRVWISNIFYGGRDYEALYLGSSSEG